MRLQGDWHYRLREKRKGEKVFLCEKNTKDFASLNNLCCRGGRYKNKVFPYTCWPIFNVPRAPSKLGVAEKSFVSFFFRGGAFRFRGLDRRLPALAVRNFFRTDSLEFFASQKFVVCVGSLCAFIVLEEISGEAKKSGGGVGQKGEKKFFVLEKNKMCFSV